jgi:hypothetical protein
MAITSLNGRRLALLAAAAATAATSCTLPGFPASSSTPSPAGPNLNPTNGVVAYDPDHKVVLLVTAGTRRQTELLQTWAWNGRTWARRNPAVSPPARSEALLAYDPRRQVMVLQGGLASNNPGGLTDTWEWDGASWSQRRPAHAPDSSQEPGSMTYDPIGHRMLLYQFPAQTWSWDGKDWIQIQPAHVPGLWTGNLVFDNTRVVLVGGTPDGNRTETWAWTGSDWKLLVRDHAPKLPALVPIVLDGARNKVLLFGGGPGDDTWTWDSSRWVREHPRHSPVSSWPALLIYDAALGEVVAFTGFDQGAITGSYAWNGSDWTALATTTPAAVPAGNGTISVIQAELTIRRTATNTHPILLPNLPTGVNQALVTVDATGFSLRAMNDDRSIEVTLGIIVPGNSNLGAAQKTLAFRRDAASYQYIAGDPTGWRDIWWMERPGSSTSDFGLTDRTGIPYLLSATGLTEAQFFSLAASLH